MRELKLDGESVMIEPMVVRETVRVITFNGNSATLTLVQVFLSAKQHFWFDKLCIISNTKVWFAKKLELLAMTADLILCL